LAAPTAAAAQAQRAPGSGAAAAGQAYERVAAAWRGTATLEARFEQRVVNALVGRSALSRGVFRQQRPNQVAITFTDPAGDQIVGDGRFLWVSLPSSTPGQVLKLPAGADGAVVADLLSQLLDTPRRAFDISGGDPADVLGRRSRRVELVPRQEGRVPFTRAVLWLDEDDLRPLRVQVQDPQGVERTITLLTWQAGIALPADAFRFVLPKGARVITELPGGR
jgi:outer membrane lipoprotein carrier protein